MSKAIQVRHIGIVVKDLQRSLWFYQDLLGLELQRRMLEKGICIENVLALKGVEIETVKLGTKEGSTQIELVSFHSHPVSAPEGVRTLIVGPTHVAFTVINLSSLYVKMIAAEIEFNCPPRVSPDGKFFLTYCKDPDGTLIELVQIL